jgi:hypothetical protein
MSVKRKQTGLQLVISCLLLLMITHEVAFAQLTHLPADTVKRDTLPHSGVAMEDLSTQYDLMQWCQEKMGHKHQNSSGIIIVPNIASTPSIGFEAGVKAVAGRKLGNDPKTLLSIAAASATVSTKGNLYFYVNHNVYTPGNKWNYQGNFVVSRMVTSDYGFGIGHMPPAKEEGEDDALNNPTRIKRENTAQYYSFREKVYHTVSEHWYVGAGASFDIRRKVKENDTSGLTPYDIYSVRHGFARDHYLANGLLFNVQYTTRDNQNRAYKGIYLDAGFRINQTWLGSTKNALEFTSDFRKYFSLSARNPAHVLAFWNWGGYVLAGNVPYMELPGTGRDMYQRSGRGYEMGYFNGTQYNYSEVEYRFPILRNQFLSGVAFFNVQTANDESGTRLFQVWQPGGGVGLRVLFNKLTRTNLCLDYAIGNYQSRGFFLGLNEAF